MLAGYEDRPHLIPASGRPPCGSVSAAGRRLYIAPACGRASAASLRPYLIPACVRASAAGLRMLCSHVRPACGGTLSRVSAASLRPYLIPACVRASAAGLRPYLMPASGGRLHALQVSLKGGGLNDEKMKCHLPTYLHAKFEIPYTLRSKRFLL
jgi:hypothetical protein